MVFKNKYKKVTCRCVGYNTPIGSRALPTGRAQKQWHPAVVSTSSSHILVSKYFSARNQCSLEKWLILQLGQRKDKRLKHSLAPESETHKTNTKAKLKKLLLTELGQCE